MPMIGQIGKSLPVLSNYITQKTELNQFMEQQYKGNKQKYHSVITNKLIFIIVIVRDLCVIKFHKGDSLITRKTYTTVLIREVFFL